MIGPNLFRNTWLTSNELTPPPSLYHVTLSDLIDQLTRLIIRRLISQTVLQQLAQTWHCPVAEGALLDLYLFCLFGFGFIGLTLNQSSGPFVITQCLQRASAHHCNGTYPGRRHHQNHFWVSYKRPHHQKAGIGLRVSLFLPAELCVLHRPLADIFSKRQYYLRRKV